MRRRGAVRIAADPPRPSWDRRTDSPRCSPLYKFKALVVSASSLSLKVHISPNFSNFSCTSLGQSDPRSTTIPTSCAASHILAATQTYVPAPPITSEVLVVHSPVVGSRHSKVSKMKRPKVATRIREEEVVIDEVGGDWK